MPTAFCFSTLSIPLVKPYAGTRPWTRSCTENLILGTSEYSKGPPVHRPRDVLPCPDRTRRCPRARRSQRALSGYQPGPAPGVSPTRPRDGRDLALGRAVRVPERTPARRPDSGLAPRRATLDRTGRTLQRVAELTQGPGQLRARSR